MENIKMLSLLSLDDCKKRELMLLKHFDKFCREHNLKYSMGEGSLIGAIRHKGFIPWDDDIDILMVRDEYEKFCALYRDDKYPLITNKTRKDWFERIARIEDIGTILFDAKTGCPWPNGLWIAIIPIDNYPNQEWRARLLDIESKMYAHLCCIKHSNKVGKSLIATILHYIIPKYFKFENVEMKFDKIAQKYNNQPTNRRGVVIGWWHKRPYVCSASAFDEYLDVPFEDMTTMVFGGYDEYLRCQYGDWTQLPSVEDRVAKHGFVAYLKSEC